MFTLKIAKIKKTCKISLRFQNSWVYITGPDHNKIYIRSRSLESATFFKMIYNSLKAN